ncbi:MAG: response regulator [Rubrivivax sp.]|nr:response regulator [Rubrivivax sp.]
MSGHLPRVLLVEDDASIRRFVELALEDSGVDLVQAGSLAAAIDALRTGPFVLILCDLMLPDGSGFDLLQSLAEPDAPSPGMRRVAFSAGVSAQARLRLKSLGVDEVLSKPVSLAALLACVEGAADRGRAEATPTPAPIATAHAADHAVAAFFGGNRQLYETFLAQCRQQWRRDAEMGDLALQQGDLPALRRLAHSLKSVLTTLGLAADGALAQSLEHAAAEGRAEATGVLWSRLRARLLACAAEPAA